METEVKSIVDGVISLRQKLCPRTSYATAGRAAYTLFVMTAEAAEKLDSLPLPLSLPELKARMVGANEFEEVSHVERAESFPNDVQNGALLVLNPRATDLQLLPALLSSRKCKLILLLTPSTQKLGDLSSLASGLQAEEVPCGSWLLTALVSTRSSLPAPTLGFNQQPSVQTRAQFRYLWTAVPLSQDSDMRREGKLRVLQRLSDHEVFNPSGNGSGSKKLTPREWDAIISHELAQGADDWQIYSRIRQVTLGHSLDEARAGNTAPSLSSSSGPKDSDEGDGRASHLIDLTLQCLPAFVQSAGIRSLLDFGCAEGALTAELGRRLGLSAQQIYGADVRAITSNPGYQFLHLPSCTPGAPPPAELLPTLADGSIHVITSAMVFHHVENLDQTIQELRAKIHPQGVLILREHDCHSVSMAVVLDIIHGLFSLAWSQPVEWPDFVEEYNAFYRSRETWNEVLQARGFKRFVEEDNKNATWQYQAASKSIYREDKGRFPNVTRAYYAVYVPDPSYRRIDRPIQVGEGEKKEKIKKRARFAEDIESKGGSTPAFPNSVLVIESKTSPGRFFAYNKHTKTSEWITFAI